MRFQILAGMLRRPGLMGRHPDLRVNGMVDGNATIDTSVRENIDEMRSMLQDVDRG
jgi:hypothetical protein